LFGNGIKFTQKGEVVTQVKILSSPGPDASSGKPWHLHFSIRDTGIGIPADRLARLFKPFTQADASTARHFGGTGLGLTISRRLVELMGGKMWVESVPQKGSTFHFTLSLQAAPQTPRLALEDPQPQLADLRLLIVDDNPTNCRILTLQTSKWGMIPRGAQSGPQALEWLRAGERFDLAILDMQMPGMDGLMLAGEIRKLPAAMAMPLVLLTSMGVHTDHPDFAGVSFASCLTKPIKPAQLHEALLRVLSGSKPAARKAPVASKLDPTLAARLPLRVLLCDDNVINQKVALRLLQQMGYRADLAANGIEALAALDRQPYDLIFMDVMMPEMDGLKATRIIRERQGQRSQFPNYKSSVIIVAMTASAMQGDREKCLAAGMDDYIAKPVRLEDVRTIVERWGALVAASDSAQTAVCSPQTATATQAGPAPASLPADIPPVEMERLLDFTEGNPDNLRELVTLYLSQTSEQIEQLEAAVQSAAPADVRRLAHSCAGASATCGMRRLVPLLRELERQGFEEKLTNAAQLCQEISREFERIRGFLEEYMARHSPLASQT
jgi:CheY-like chemotaxis protein